MTSRLALFELGLIGAAVCAADRSGDVLGADGVTGALVAMARAAALSICCVLAFYYQDLYDLRAIRSFRSFLTRLPRSVALALFFAAALCCAAPWIAPPLDTLGRAVATAAALVVGFRLVLYALCAIARSRAFGRRTLVLGTGSLAAQIADELGSGSESRDTLIGL